VSRRNQCDPEKPFTEQNSPENHATWPSSWKAFSGRPSAYNI
jgi:hypothetical protein